MSFKIFDIKICAKAVLVLSVAISFALAESPIQSDLIEYDVEASAAWRERFEKDIRHQSVQLSGEEKAAVFKEYMTRIYEREETMKELIEEGNQEMVLNGQVLDQGGRPVPNAKVEAVVREDRSIGVKFHRLQTIQRDADTRTDAAGNFTLNGGRGRSISIQNISAPGYVFIVEQQMERRFDVEKSSSLLKPQSKNTSAVRAVFKVWKQIGKPDKLVVQDAHFRIEKNEKKYMFNVFCPRGKNSLREVGESRVLDGDFLFSVVSSDVEERVFFRIEAVDGGVSEQGLLGLIAPVSGYVPTYDMDIAEGKRKSTIFVRSRNGRIYTKLVVTAWYDSEKGRTYVDIKYASNPNGKTNLQPKGGVYRGQMLKALDKDVKLQERGERTGQKSSTSGSL